MDIRLQAGENKYYAKDTHTQHTAHADMLGIHKAVVAISTKMHL